MADVCKKCGAVVPSGSGFCSSCGAPVEAAAIAPAAVPAPVVPPQPVYAAAPPKKSGGALKIVLIVIAVVVVVGAASVAVLGYFGYRALHTAGSTFSLGKGADVTDADLGVSVYPGAVKSTNGAMRMNLAGNLVVSAMYTTPDSTSDVVSFYQGKLANATTSQSGNSTTLTSATVDGSLKDAVVITVTPSGQGGTQMVIVHTKTSKP